MEFWTVYGLRCSDDVLYIGCTSDLERRILEHESGKCKYTVGRKPFKLEFSISLPDKYLAFNLERYLKKGSGRAFIKRHLVKV